MEEKFVSTFEAACTKLGISDELPDVSAWPEQLQKHLTATYMLSKILEVNNGGLFTSVSLRASTSGNP